MGGGSTLPAWKPPWLPSHPCGHRGLEARPRADAHGLPWTRSGGWWVGTCTGGLTGCKTPWEMFQQGGREGGFEKAGGRLRAARTRTGCSTHPAPAPPGRGSRRSVVTGPPGSSEGVDSTQVAARRQRGRARETAGAEAGSQAGTPVRRAPGARSLLGGRSCGRLRAFPGRLSFAPTLDVRPQMVQSAGRTCHVPPFRDSGRPGRLGPASHRRCPSVPHLLTWGGIGCHQALHAEDQSPPPVWEV